MRFDKTKIKSLKQILEEYVLYIVYNTNNQREASSFLGISQKTITKVLKKYGISGYRKETANKEIDDIISVENFSLPNLTPTEWEFLLNRDTNCKIPDEIRGK